MSRRLQRLDYCTLVSASIMQQLPHKATLCPFSCNSCPFQCRSSLRIQSLACIFVRLAVSSQWQRGDNGETGGLQNRVLKPRQLRHQPQRSTGERPTLFVRILPFAVHLFWPETGILFCDPGWIMDLLHTMEIQLIAIFVMLLTVTSPYDRQKGVVSISYCQSLECG